MSRGFIVTTHTIRPGPFESYSSDSNVKEKSSEKVLLVSIIWSMSVIHSLPALFAGVWYDAEFFYPSILPDLEKKLCEGTRRKARRGSYLHPDNARAHNAKWSGQERARTKAMNFSIRPVRQILHPATSSCLAI
jgi:hypothetical protein